MTNLQPSLFDNLPRGGVTLPGVGHGRQCVSRRTLGLAAKVAKNTQA